MKARKEISKDDALQKAQMLCAEKEKCIYDIKQKLYDWKLPANNHDWVINKLIDEKFIDEKRYSKFFAKDKFLYNKWGKIKIEFALKQKQIPDDLIKVALDEIPENDYDDLLKNELIKKLNSIKDSSEYVVKSKLARFAASRGFESGKVFDMISEIIEKHKNG